jgi:hypothetical protein
MRWCSALAPNMSATAAANTAAAAWARPPGANETSNDPSASATKNA